MDKFTSAFNPSCILHRPKMSSGSEKVITEIPVGRFCHNRTDFYILFNNNRYYKLCFIPNIPSQIFPEVHMPPC
jgi:hypothetical protein